MPYDQALEKSLRKLQREVTAAEEARAPETLSASEVKVMLEELDKEVSKNTSTDAARARQTIAAAAAYLDKPDPTIPPRDLALTLSVLRHDRAHVERNFALQLQVNLLFASDMKKCDEFEQAKHTPQEKERFYKARLDSIQARVNDAVAKGEMTQKHAQNILNALEFYRNKVSVQEEWQKVSNTIREILAVDFSHRVTDNTYPKGQQLYQQQPRGHLYRVGAFYTATPPITSVGRAAVSGIAAGAVCARGEDPRHIGEEKHAAPQSGRKSIYVSRAERPISALSSRAAPTVDTWSGGVDTPVAGSGHQLRVSDGARTIITRTGELEADRWGRPVDPSLAGEVGAPAIPTRPLAVRTSAVPAHPPATASPPESSINPQAQQILAALGSSNTSSPPRPTSSRRSHESPPASIFSDTSVSTNPQTSLSPTATPSSASTRTSHRPRGVGQT